MIPASGFSPQQFYFKPQVDTGNRDAALLVYTKSVKSDAALLNNNDPYFVIKPFYSEIIQYLFPLLFGALESVDSLKWIDFTEQIQVEVVFHLEMMTVALIIYEN